MPVLRVDVVTLHELCTAYRLLRSDLAAACDPASPLFSPIAAEREGQRLADYARQIADLVADTEPAELASV